MEIRFFADKTWAGNFTVVVITFGTPEFRFDTAEQAESWINGRGGFIGAWETNRWGNEFRPGEIEFIEPGDVAQVTPMAPAPAPVSIDEGTFFIKSATATIEDGEVKWRK